MRSLWPRDGGNLVKARYASGQHNKRRGRAVAFWGVLGEMTSEQAGARPARLEKVIPMLKTCPTSFRAPRWGKYAHQNPYFQRFSARCTEMACFDDERDNNVRSTLSISSVVP